MVVLKSFYVHFNANINHFNDGFLVNGFPIQTEVVTAPIKYVESVFYTKTFSYFASVQ